MKVNNLPRKTLVAAVLLLSVQAGATRFEGLQVIDQETLVVRFQDGDIRYRDDGTGPSAYLGHSFAEGDDTLLVFLPRLDPSATGWTVTSTDDPSFGTVRVTPSRKSKPMYWDHTLMAELEHWIFLPLAKPMKQGCTYTVHIPAGTGSDTASATVTFDIWNSFSEAVHVNILGYSPGEKRKAADLYIWLGDGGARDYKTYEGKKVWLYNVDSKTAVEAGEVRFWKKAEDSRYEAGKKDLTGSDVWNIDFTGPRPGRYRLVVEDVGCSMDFNITDDVYYEPYRYSVRGYYYMRLQEPMDPDHVWPVPRQPQFTPGVDPEGFVVYKTDLHPWHPDWRKLRGDVWDEPHFKAREESAFWAHRLPGNPVNMDVVGGHSDAFDWDRHLAHVSNIYDLLLPYLLTGGRLSEDHLGIRESGNGIPDIVDEARNEVDFFLSIRDGEAYSQGVTNPDKDWTVMFQAGCTTMAAWANAANCAMLAEAFRIGGYRELQQFYTDEAVKAFRFASRQENLQLDDTQGIGDGSMRGRDFRQMASAFLYNLTGDKEWEDAMAEESVVKGPASSINNTGRGGWWQVWGTAAYLTCPHERHYPELYENMVASVKAQAFSQLDLRAARPSRRSADDPRWQVSENLQLVMLAHAISQDAAQKKELEQALYDEAGWGLGRNPSNTVEMTGLGQRHITDCYTTGRNDGAPGSHPGQTPFNGTETWSPGHNGGDARVILERCYPDWNTGGWPRQESFFNQRYFWVNGEFTPRETMRGKMALLGYLYGIR
jgi:hypothetical protein